MMERRLLKANCHFQKESIFVEGDGRQVGLKNRGREEPMPKLAIIGTVEVSPGRIDEVLPRLMAHRARCLESEPGTLQFEVLKPHRDDTKFLLYEVYEDEAAFGRHWDGPSMAIARRECAGIIVNVSGVRCDLQEQAANDVISADQLNASNDE